MSADASPQPPGAADPAPHEDTAPGIGTSAGQSGSEASALLGSHPVDTADAMEELGARFGRVLGAGDVLVLTGPLGAGKTTFTRGLAEALGVRGPVQSPTFVIARTHPSLVGGPALVHVDAYRLGSAAELDDLDLDLVRSVVVVEWGREMASALTDEWWDVEITRPVAGADDIAPEDLDGDAPRLVTVRRVSA